MKFFQELWQFFQFIFTGLWLVIVEIFKNIFYY